MRDLTALDEFGHACQGAARSVGRHHILRSRPRLRAPHNVRMGFDDALDTEDTHFSIGGASGKLGRVIRSALASMVVR
jgi:hypothetical protein